MAEKVVVAGAGFAGVNAALELASEGLAVRVLDSRKYHEFTPGIINIFRDRVSRDSLRLDLEEFFSGTGIEFSQEYIQGIDPEEKTVETGDRSYGYDHLVVALGGDPRTFGMDLSDAYTPYSLEEAGKISEELQGGEEILVVGSGYVGVEIGSELAETGYDVTIVDQATRPMPNSPEKASHFALEYFENTGIKFRGGKKVTEVREDGVKTGDDRIEADLVVWAGGVQASRLVQQELDAGKKGLEVNAGLSSVEYPEVFALGDVADDGSLKTAHNAMQQAGVAAGNVSRDTEELERYEEGTNPLVVSLGKKGLFLYGDRVYRSRFIRYLKDLVRWRYWALLKWKKLKLRRFN